MKKRLMAIEFSMIGSGAIALALIANLSLLQDKLIGSVKMYDKEALCPLQLYSRKRNGLLPNENSICIEYTIIKISELQ